MIDSSFAEITQSAVDSMANAPNTRLRDVLSVVLRHLHDAVRETRPTVAQWEAVIAFLTRTGETCRAERQEVILLSDVLGVSMLVDALNHAGSAGVSESTVFGPFYAGSLSVLPAGASILKRAEKGASLQVCGTVRSQNGTLIGGALVEVGQAAPNGLYAVQDPAQPASHLRASFKTAADGSFAFETILPVSYAIPYDGPVGDLLQALGRHPNRPAHIHFMITAAGCRRLVTHLFIDGDSYLESDAVFGVKSPLIVLQQQRADGSLAIDHVFTLADAPTVDESGLWRVRPNAPLPGTPLGPVAENPGRRRQRISLRTRPQRLRNVRRMPRGHRNTRLSQPLPAFFAAAQPAPDQFIRDGHILCMQHFALFRADTGACFSGVCEGRSLIRIPVAVSDSGLLAIAS